MCTYLVFLCDLPRLPWGGTTAILPPLSNKHESRGWRKQEGDGRQGSKVCEDFTRQGNIGVCGLHIKPFFLLVDI